MNGDTYNNNNNEQNNINWKLLEEQVRNEIKDQIKKRYDTFIGLFLNYEKYVNSFEQLWYKIMNDDSIATHSLTNCLKPNPRETDRNYRKRVKNKWSQYQGKHLGNYIYFPIIKAIKNNQSQSEYFNALLIAIKAQISFFQSKPTPLIPFSTYHKLNDNLFRQLLINDKDLKLDKNVLDTKQKKDAQKFVLAEIQKKMAQFKHRHNNNNNNDHKHDINKCSNNINKYKPKQQPNNHNDNENNGQSIISMITSLENNNNLYQNYHNINDSDIKLEDENNNNYHDDDNNYYTNRVPQSQQQHQQPYILNGNLLNDDNNSMISFENNDMMNKFNANDNYYHYNYDNYNYNHNNNALNNDQITNIDNIHAINTYSKCTEHNNHNTDNNNNNNNSHVLSDNEMTVCNYYDYNDNNNVGNNYSVNNDQIMTDINITHDNNNNNNHNNNMDDNQPMMSFGSLNNNNHNICNNNNHILNVNNNIDYNMHNNNVALNQNNSSEMISIPRKEYNVMIQRMNKMQNIITTLTTTVQRLQKIMSECLWFVGSVDGNTYQ